MNTANTSGIKRQGQVQKTQKTHSGGCFLQAVSKKTRLKLFEGHRNTKGIIGIGIRYALLKSLAEKCGENVSIHPGCYILHPLHLSVGDNVSFFPMCYIECGNTTGKGVYIGNDVAVAHGASVIATLNRCRQTFIRYTV